jgi:O-glycosyl hydrolase
MTAGGIMDNGAERASDVSVTIDNAIEYQTMDGFGATHQSLVYQVNGVTTDYLGATLRAQAIDALYSQVGLNLGNLYGSGGLETPGDYSQRQNDNANPFNIDPAGFDFFGDAAHKDFVIDQAGATFPDYYIAPKNNIRWNSPWLADVRAADYNNYLHECAEQTLAGQLFWRDTYGIVPKYTMLFNEPLGGNGELAPGSEQEVVDIVKRAGARLRGAGFDDILFVVPGDETEQSSLGIATAILTDHDARQYVGVIAYHAYPYGSTYSSISRILETSGTGNPEPDKIAVRNQLRDLGAQYGLPVWMTEISNGGIDPRSFDSLRGRAIHIHDEFIYANASAYFGMNSMWDLQSELDHFGDNQFYQSRSEGNVVLIDQGHNEVTITGIGYAIGHYARWFDPGAIRIEALSSDPLVQITTFRDDAQGRIVLVVINNALSTRTLDINFNSIELVGNLTGEQSTSVARWQALTPFAPTTSSNFAATLPPESVTTFASSYLGETCVADFTGDGVLDFFDVSAFLAAFSAGDSAGDFNNDGIFDFFDVSAFLAAFAAGCP